MKWFLGIVGIVIAIVGGIQLGASIEGEPSSAEPIATVFSYNDATPDERLVWMNELASKLEKKGKREASRSQFVSYKETNVKVRSREIQTVLRLGHYANMSLNRKMIDDTLTSVCPYYVEHGLYANDIKWTQKIVKRDGSVALNLPITRRSCQRFMTSG